MTFLTASEARSDGGRYAVMTPLQLMAQPDKAPDVEVLVVPEGNDNALNAGRGSSESRRQSAVVKLVTDLPALAKPHGAASSSTTCPICRKTLPRPLETQTAQIRSLKPRFVRELKRVYPYIQFNSDVRICVKDLYIALNSRIEQLLEEDQTELSRLLDDAMKSLGEYEAQEDTWQKQFESGWTLGERAADLVARFGGSWRFIICLIAFLATWISVNVILTNYGTEWDIYPFTLLNLMLSSVAALQAPIIMMSQNRQAQIDRTQNDYVSKIVLRGEHQVRHVNAKVDHLVSHQWKRLLEIQEIQIDLLQNLLQQSRRLSSNNPMTPLFSATVSTPGMRPTDPFVLPNAAVLSNPSVKQTSWSVETVPDDHLRMLLAQRFDTKSGIDDMLVFAHWHTDGDNFVGDIENISFEMKGDILRRVTYEVSFIDSTATLDDIFAGEGTVTFRNDFDQPSMVLAGRIVKVAIHHKDKPSATFANGELPTRYRPSFFPKRIDKITDFFRLPVQQVGVTYSPPHHFAVLRLGEHQTVSGIKVDFFPRSGIKRASVFSRRLAPDCEATTYLSDIFGPRPLPAIWSQVATASWETEGNGDAVLGEASPLSVLVDNRQLIGPGIWIFVCDEVGCDFQGVINDQEEL